MSNENKKTIIERVRVVPESKWMTFLVEHFGTPLFDQIVFRYADRLVKGYSGGCWEYCTVADSNAAFLRLGSEKNHILINPFSGEEVEAGDTVAGLVVTSYALLGLIEQAGENAKESHIDLYHAIRSAILDYCEEEQCLSVYWTMID